MTDDIRNHLRSLAGGDRIETWESAKALISINNELAELMRLVSEGPSPDVRAAAAYVIGFSRLSVARDRLECCLANRSEDPMVRGYAAEALGYLGASASSLNVLIAQLDDPDICVRYWCVFALGVAGDPSAVPDLLRLREGLTGEERCGEHSLQQEIADALAQIADHQRWRRTELAMPLKYQSGDEIKKGDRVMFHGEPGEIEFVVDGLVGDPAMDWYFNEMGPGVMVQEPKVFGHPVYLTRTTEAEDLVFVSRGAHRP